MAQIQVDSEHVLAANSTIQATIAKLQAEVDGLHVQLTVDAQLGELGQALRLAANQYSEIELANQRLFMG